MNCISDIVHRDLKLENILLSQPVGNELLNIKVRFRNVTMYLVTKLNPFQFNKIYITCIWACIFGMLVK